jgi:hypothetical protein
MEKFLNQFKNQFQYKEGQYQFHTTIDGLVYYYESTINKGTDMWSCIEVDGVDYNNHEVKRQISELVFAQYNR